MADSGYVFVGAPSPDDLRRAKAGRAAATHPVVNVSDVEPWADADRFGWRDAAYRELLSTAEPVPAAIFAASIRSGGARAAHRLAADAYYFVERGTGVVGSDAGERAWTAQHVWFVPAGELGWIRADEEMDLYGFLVGAPSLRVAGYTDG